MNPYFKSAYKRWLWMIIPLAFLWALILGSAR